MHTPRGDQPVMMRRGHSVGNAAKWSIPRWSGTRSGSVGMVQTEPGSAPSGLYAPELGPTGRSDFCPPSAPTPSRPGSDLCASLISSTAE